MLTEEINVKKTAEYLENYNLIGSDHISEKIMGSYFGGNYENSIRFYMGWRQEYGLSVVLFDLCTN
jgi:hypothetical protein